MNTELTAPDTTIERLPPQSVEAEQAVLGALLVNGEVISRIVDMLEPEYFYRKAHQVIYAAMLDLFDKSEPIDIVTVSQYLKDASKLENVGGRQYLTDLAMSIATTANVEYYAKAVHEKAMLRNLIKAGTEIVASCYEDNDADIIIDKAEHLIFGLAQRKNLAQLVHIRDIVESSFAKIEERYENRDSLSGAPSGFYDLDSMTSGFQPSDLIIVAARPSMGKCLSYDSEIVVSDGSVATIEELYRSRHAELLTLKDDYKLSWTSASHFVDDGIKPVYRVTTRLGRSIETTLSHPFLTITGWKRLEEIAVGDRVAVPRAIPVFGRTTMRDCEVKLLAYLIGDGCVSNGKASFTNTNGRIQEDFIDAVNSFGGVSTLKRRSDTRADAFDIRGDQKAIAEGRLEFAGQLRQAINSNDRTFAAVATAVGVSPGSVTMWTQGSCVPKAETFERLASVLALDVSKLAPAGHAAISRSSKNPIALWLEEQGLWGKRAHEKSIPPQIFTLERELLALFLNRLFATDGWATVLTSGQPQVGYATVSEKLGRQIQHLLLRFGVIAKLRSRKVKYNDGVRQCWQLDITDARSIETFINDIGIHGKETALSIVETAIARRRRQSNRDLIPIQIWDEIRRLKGTESWCSLATRCGFTDTTNIHAGKRAPTRGRLLSLAKGLDDQHLKDLAESDVYWDEIVSIEPMGMKQVYDLTIPETHNFIANDVCVHNTAFCLNIAQYVAVEKNVPVAVFSLEMSREQLVMRMLCSVAEIDANRLRTGYLQNNDWNRLAMAMGKLGEAPIFIDDSAVVTALDIRAKCRRLKAEYKNLGLVVIDYIQLMQGRKVTDNRVQEVSEISRSLKTLARELSVPVIALSQLSRAVEARQNKRPMLSDLRESGSIEQDADIVMFIYRDEYYNPESEHRGEAEIIVSKQRNGPTGTVELLYQASITRFLNKVHNYQGG